MRQVLPDSVVAHMRGLLPFLAPLAVAVCPGFVAASVVLDPRLHPLGTEVVVDAKGEATDFDSLLEWTPPIRSGAGVNMTADNCLDSSAWVDCAIGGSYVHRGYVTGGTALHNYSAGVAKFGAGGTVRMYGYTFTMTNDQVTVETSSSNPGLVTLSFTFVMSGSLTRVVASEDAGYPNLDAAGGFDLATYSRAQLSMATAVGLPQVHVLHVASQSTINGRNPLTAKQEEFLDYLDPDQARANSEVFEPTDIMLDAKTVPVNRKEVVGLVGGVQPGAPVWANFMLETGYSLYARNIDFAGLYLSVESDFEHTAELESVELLNADGTPYIGAWELHSAAGIAYPLLMHMSGTVPEPAIGALAAMGLMAFAARRRRQMGPRTATRTAM